VITTGGYVGSGEDIPVGHDAHALRTSSCDARALAMPLH
jgi:hypothetical protein